jgi:hypothetical protein
VAVGLGERVRVALGVREAIDGKEGRVGVGWLDGEQACNPVRSISRNVISFLA